jgi:hypothetical protein
MSSDAAARTTPRRRTQHGETVGAPRGRRHGRRHRLHDHLAASAGAHPPPAGNIFASSNSSLHQVLAPLPGTPSASSSSCPSCGVPVLATASSTYLHAPHSMNTHQFRLIYVPLSPGINLHYHLDVRLSRVSGRPLLLNLVVCGCSPCHPPVPRSPPNIYGLGLVPCSAQLEPSTAVVLPMETSHVFPTCSVSIQQVPKLRRRGAPCTARTHSQRTHGDAPLSQQPPSQAMIRYG